MPKPKFEIGQKLAVIGDPLDKPTNYFSIISFQGIAQEIYPFKRTYNYLLKDLIGCDVYGDVTLYQNPNFLLPENLLIAEPPGYSFIKIGSMIPLTSERESLIYSSGVRWTQFFQEYKSSRYNTCYWPIVLKDK